MEYLKDVGFRISMLRKAKGITQDALAQKVGYTSRSTINKIEKGLVDIPQSKIIDIAEALDTTPAYLMGWSEEKENSPEEISEGEKEWLDLYRSLPEASRLQLSKSLKAFERLPEHLQTVALQEFALQMLQAKLNDQ